MTLLRFLSLTLLISLAPCSAQAAACCALSAPGRSGRIPEGEIVAVVLGLGTELRPGSWTSDGELRFARDDLQLTQTLSPQVIWRPHRVVQGSVALPLLLNLNRYGDVELVGAGPGDLRLTLRLEPLPPGLRAGLRPVLGFALGASLPTGRSVAQVHDGNAAMTTGSGFVVLTPALSVDRSFHWGSVGGDVSVGLPLPVNADVLAPGIAWSVSGFAAFLASSRVTVTATLGGKGSGPGRLNGRALGSPQLEPFAGVGLVLEPRHLRRVLLGLEGSLPIPGLGLARAVSVVASVGGSLSFPRRGATVDPPAPRHGVMGDPSASRGAAAGDLPASRSLAMANPQASPPRATAAPSAPGGP